MLGFFRFFDFDISLLSVFLFWVFFTMAVLGKSVGGSSISLSVNTQMLQTEIWIQMIYSHTQMSIEKIYSQRQREILIQKIYSENA